MITRSLEDLRFTCRNFHILPCSATVRYTALRFQLIQYCQHEVFSYLEPCVITSTTVGDSELGLADDAVCVCVCVMYTSSEKSTLRATFVQ